MSNAARFASTAKTMGYTRPYARAGCLSFVRRGCGSCSLVDMICLVNVLSYCPFHPFSFSQLRIWTISLTCDLCRADGNQN